MEANPFPGAYHSGPCGANRVSHRHIVAISSLSVLGGSTAPRVAHCPDPGLVVPAFQLSQGS